MITLLISLCFSYIAAEAALSEASTSEKKRRISFQDEEEHQSAPLTAVRTPTLVKKTARARALSDLASPPRPPVEARASLGHYEDEDTDTEFEEEGEDTETEVDEEDLEEEIDLEAPSSDESDEEQEDLIEWIIFFKHDNHTEHQKSRLEKQRKQKGQ